MLYEVITNQKGAIYRSFFVLTFLPAERNDSSRAAGRAKPASLARRRVDFDATIAPHNRVVEAAVDADVAIRCRDVA